MPLLRTRSVSSYIQLYSGSDVVVLILHRLPQTLGHGLNETSGIGQLLSYSINGIFGDITPTVDTPFMTPLPGERG